MIANSTSRFSAALVAGLSALLLAATAHAAAPVKAVEGAAHTAGKATGLPVVQVAKKRPRVKRVGPKVLRRGAVVRRRLAPHHRYHRRRALNRGIGIGIGIGIIAFIAQQAANAEFQAAMRRCARDYNSFDWETGTYVAYGGDVRVCPYLRPYL